MKTIFTVIIAVLLCSSGCIRGGDDDSDISNTAPVANAGPDQAVSVVPVNLDGSESSDADGDSLTYSWTFFSTPSGSTLVNSDITNADTDSPSFIPDVEGKYSILLIVNDGIVDSDLDIVTIDFDETPPIANAGEDQAVSLTPVNLDGSGSSDAGGGSIIYSWTFSSIPSGSSLNNTDITGMETDSPSFIPDVDGEYTLSLIVNDGILDSDPDTVTIDFDKTQPIANAGDDQIVSSTPVNLDGSGSSDAGEDPITYSWTLSTLPSGSSLDNSDITNADTGSPSFIPDSNGEYIISLIVNDGINDSDPDTISIFYDANKPVADAGDNQSVSESPVSLDGSGSSDADGDSLTYSWTFSSIPSGSTLDNSDITNAETTSPRFIPDVDGEYTLSLVVNDGILDSDPDTVTIDFDVTPPIANAGDDQIVSSTPVNLDGSGSSDAGEGPITYSWTFSTLPSGSSLDNSDITNADTGSPSFIPDSNGEYIISLIVNDGINDSDPDTISIFYDVTQPVADAGDNQSVSESPVSLDGGGSSDADGDSLTYSWTFSVLPSGSTLNNTDITGADTASLSFDPDVDGEYTLSLIVNDGILDSDPDTVTIDFDGTPPIANAGDDQTVSSTPVSLDGSGSSDAGGGPITYAWTFSSIPAESILINSDITNAETVSPSFIPDVDGEYIISLIVNDGTFDSDPDTVTINYANTLPVADAGADQGVTATGTTVILDGSGSNDADGDSVTYAWTFSSVPAGSSLLDTDITDADTETPEFTPDVIGAYEVTLLVNDGRADSEADTVKIVCVIADNGGVIDIATSGSEFLAWKKCSQGQEWVENDCSGDIEKFQYCSDDTGDCDNGTILDGSEDNGNISEVWNTCDELNGEEFAGRTGWRAPTISELEAFYNMSIDANYSSYFHITTFAEYIDSFYWSSTRVGVTRARSFAFYSNGSSGDTLKDYPCNVQCVTGP